MRGGDENQRGLDPRLVLISDADRDQISAVLDQHVAEGRLTMEELERRVGLLLAARTRGQAAVATAGLPALTGSGGSRRLHFWRDRDATPELPSWLLPRGVLVDDRAPERPHHHRSHDSPRQRQRADEENQRAIEAEHTRAKANAAAAQELYEEVREAGGVDTSVAWICPLCGQSNHAGARRCTQCRREF